jgi:hypothetical protein
MRRFFSGGRRLKQNLDYLRCLRNLNHERTKIINNYIIMIIINVPYRVFLWQLLSIVVVYVVGEATILSRPIVFEAVMLSVGIGS